MLLALFLLLCSDCALIPPFLVSCSARQVGEETLVRDSVDYSDLLDSEEREEDKKKK